jgi:outer membrane protein OmpA-like peptidoglycan-associated protein
MNPRIHPLAIAGAFLGLAIPQLAAAGDDPAAKAALERHLAQSAQQGNPSSQPVGGGGPSVEQMLEVFTQDVPEDLTVAAKRPQVDLDIKFDFDSAQLDPAGIEQLDTAGRALSDPRLASRRFMLGGHTDDRGNPEYNRELSLRRAESARQYLIEEHGIAPERLETAGFGYEHPKVDDKTEQARKVNRRVVLEMIE